MEGALSLQDTHKDDQLTRLINRNRQLFFLLGRETDKQKIKQMCQEMSTNKKSIQLFGYYQKFRILKKQQKQLRVQLQQVMQQFFNLRVQVDQYVKQNSNYQNSIMLCQQCFKSLKEGDQMLHKLHTYNEEIEIVENVKSEFKPSQIAFYLSAVNYEKSQVLEEKQRIQKKADQLKIKNQALTQKIQQENILYQKLLIANFQNAKKIELLKFEKFQKMRAASQKEEQEDQEESFKKEQFRAKTNVIHHEVIIQRVRIPGSYWVWMALLIIWALILIIKPTRPATPPDICY